jgi:Cytidylyltransferase
VRGNCTTESALTHVNYETPEREAKSSVFRGSPYQAQRGLQCADLTSLVEKLPSVCIIPARGGSKRTPGKNVRAFRGRPIIANTVATALAANCFDEVMVGRLRMLHPEHYASRGQSVSRCGAVLLVPYGAYAQRVAHPRPHTPGRS